MPIFDDEPLVKKAGATKKKKVTFADDDTLPDDMPIANLPKDAPDLGALTKGKGHTKKAGLPSKKVDTGEVAISAPKGNMSIEMARGLGNFLQNVGGEEEDIGEDTEEPEPVEPTTLPDVIQNALSTDRGEVVSYQMSNIVRQAPPPLQRQLQKIGKDIFSQYSDTPKTLKDIYAITTLTNSETEVKLMLAWILMHGRKITDAKYDFPTMPGYKPKAEVWESEGARYLIVRETPKDFAGESIEDTFDDPDFEERVDNKECNFYIYGWEDTPSEKRINGVSKQDLLETAVQIAKNRLGEITVQEAYDQLVEAFLNENTRLQEATKLSSVVDLVLKGSPEVLKNPVFYAGRHMVSDAGTPIPSGEVGSNIAQQLKRKGINFDMNAKSIPGLTPQQFKALKAIANIDFEVWAEAMRVYANNPQKAYAYYYAKTGY